VGLKAKMTSGVAAVGATAADPPEESATTDAAAEGPVQPVTRSKFTPEEDVRSFVQETLMDVLNPAIEQLLHHVHESGELQRALREKAAEEKLLQQQRDRRQSNAGMPPGGGEAGGNGDSGHPPHHRESLEGNRPSAVAAGLQEIPGSPRTKAKGGGVGSPRGKPGQESQPAVHRNQTEPVPPPEKQPAIHRRRTSRTGKDLGIGKHGEKDDEKRAATPTAAEAAEAAIAEEKDRFDPLLWLSERLREAATGPTERYREQIEKLVQEQISKTEAASAEFAAEGGGEDVAIVADADPPGGTPLAGVSPLKPAGPGTTDGA
jgi:hypothetical protein